MRIAIQHRANSSASQSFVWFTHPSTDCAQCCLTSVIEGMGALNIAYGRWLAGPVIQATGRSKFEDGLGSGDFVSGYSSYHMSVRNKIRDSQCHFRLLDVLSPYFCHVTFSPFSPFLFTINLTSFFVTILKSKYDILILFWILSDISRFFVIVFISAAISQLLSTALQQPLSKSVLPAN
jgi:hypothetical protein